MTGAKDLTLVAAGIALGYLFTQDAMKAEESSAYLRGVDHGSSVKREELELAAEAAEAAALELCPPSRRVGPGGVNYI